jgi:uncharacterized protein
MVNTASSQNKADTIKALMIKAKKSQLGINCNVDTQKAFRIYNYLASKGSPEGINELAKLYLVGEGVVRNYNYALRFFKQASDLGNSAATYNLAIMYHKGQGVKQNLYKAFELYNKAIQAGNINACYGAGYLIYKGLGVKQNYAKALEYFQKGADKGNPDCEYMIAIYYLTGHDSNQDIKKGKEYLEKSMKHGHSWIEDFTQYNIADSLIKIGLKDTNAWSDIKSGKISNIKRTLFNNANDSDLVGTWVGKLYTYDWSGKKIENEQDIKIMMSTENHVLSLQWFENENFMTSFTAQNLGKLWIAQKDKQFDLNSATRWFMYRAKFDIDKSKKNQTLLASFQKYNMDEREPLCPNIAVLEKIKNSTIVNPIYISNIYPNPFSNDIQIDFILDCNQSISIEIYDIMGVKVYSGSKANYQKGINTIAVKTNLSKGNYTLYVNGTSFSCSQKIIRK